MPGIKGQKWGVRRFQNEDGTLTEEGKRRYGETDSHTGGEGIVSRKKEQKSPYGKKDGPDHFKSPNQRMQDRIEKNRAKAKNELKDLVFSKVKKKDNLSKGLDEEAAAKKEHDKKMKEAAKDAEEYARAKAYYGEGAGTRRKKIKNKLSEKMKDEEYKKEFEKQLAQQDMAKHQKAANRERKAKDVKNTAAKIGRGIKNLILGVGTTSVTAIALYNVAKATGADKVIASKAKQAISKVKDYANRR